MLNRAATRKFNVDVKRIGGRFENEQNSNNRTKAAVKKFLVCRQPTGSYLTYRVKLSVSVFFLHNFFFDYINRGR